MRPDGTPAGWRAQRGWRTRRPNTLTSGFASHGKDVKIPRVRFDDLGRSHATRLLKEGVAPKGARERLGQATIAVTLDRYSHVMPGAREDVAARVDRALKSALGRRAKHETLTSCDQLVSICWLSDSLVLKHPTNSTAEGCRSGRTGRSRKPLCALRTVGSNPTPSATT